MDLMEMRVNHERALQRPAGVGKVFYVHNGGDAGNEGTDPDFPMTTIALALAQCRANKNDYVFVLENYSETVPIAIATEHTHIIGTGPAHGVRLVLTAPTDASIFSVGNLGMYSEIAGFNLGGGNSGAGVDLLQDTVGVWIHHNLFGHPYPGDTPLNGIMSSTGSGLNNILIEDNAFYGDGGGTFGNGTITSNGIQVEIGATAAAFAESIIRRNVFFGLVGVTRQGAVLLDGAEGVVIRDNVFHVVDGADGEAVNLIDICRYCTIIDNLAVKGMLSNAYTYNPYRDLNTNTFNGWARNYKGNAIVEPVGY